MRYYLVLMILGTVGFVTPQIFACECKFVPLDDHMKNADVVFQGTILREPVQSGKSLVASFSAIDVFKRPPPEFDHLFNAGRVNVTTGIDSGTCGVDFQAENTYIVFGVFSENKIHTTICSGTANIENYLERMLYFQYYESSPHEQFRSGVPIGEIQCEEGLILVSKSSDGSPACVKSQSVQKLTERSWGTAYLDRMIFVQGIEQSVKYSITRDAVVSGITFNNQTNSIIIEFDPHTAGNLIVELPRTLIDSGHTNCNSKYEMDAEFFVLADKEEILFEEIINTPEKRTLSIPFAENNSEIEIITMCLI